MGNLPLNLTEGDVICIFSQYGEIDDVNLVRDTDSGKSRGFAFVKYEDARSCVLAVDNLCGSVVLGRTLRVDHVEKYRLPKHVQQREDQEKNSQKGAASAGSSAGSDDDKNKTISVAEAGHAYKGQELASSYDIHSGQDLFAAPKNTETDERYHGGVKSISIQQRNMDKEERRRRKEERAQKRKEKEENRRRKEERKRKKHDGGSGSRKDKRRSRSYSK